MKDKNTKWIIAFICISPIVLIIEFQSFSMIMGLLREKSDMSVVFGIISISVLMFLNYLLIKFILTKTKSQ